MCLNLFNLFLYRRSMCCSCIFVLRWNFLFNVVTQLATDECLSDSQDQFWLQYEFLQCFFAITQYSNYVSYSFLPCLNCDLQVSQKFHIPLMLCQFTFKCDLLSQCLHSEFFKLVVVVMLSLVLFFIPWCTSVA